MGSASVARRRADRERSDGSNDCFDNGLSLQVNGQQFMTRQPMATKDGELVLEGNGGGGTSHVPIWEWLKRNDANPACVVCLTDGCTNFGDDPGVPVLWALTEDAEPPFGQKVRIA